MTNAQIKAAIKAKGYTIKAFADVLGVSYDSLRQTLSGQRTLTEQLRRHILLALQHPAPGATGESVPVGIPLTLPGEMWEAIDKAAAAQGISAEQYTANMCHALADDIAAGLTISRPLDGDK